MRKTLIITTLILASTVASAQSLRTRYGTVAVNADKVLLVNGQIMQPQVTGNNELHIVHRYQLRTMDLVLIEDVGGTSCPSTYYVLQMDRANSQVSHAFGTCATMGRVTQTATGLTFEMIGYSPPNSSRSMQQAAMREQHRYSYANGRISDVTGQR